MAKFERLDRLLLFNLAMDEDDPILGFAAGWVRALSARAGRVDVVTMRLGRVNLPRNVRVFSVGKEFGFGEPRRALRFYRILTTLLKEQRYDVCFAHMMPLFAVLGAPLLMARRVPIVLWYAHRSTTRLLRIAERAAARVLTPAGGSFGLPSSKLVTVGHGIDTALFVQGDGRTLEDDKFTVLAVGRVSPIKRLELLVNTAKLLVRGTDGSKLSVRIVGPMPDSTYRRKLEASIRSAGIQDVVRFVGPLSREQLALEYQQAHVLVHPAPTGAIDKVVLEAMASGTPIAVANEAFADVFRDVSIPLPIPANTPERIAEACERVRGWSPEYRSQMGELLRDVVVRQHSLERLADVIIDICLSCRS